MPRVVVRRMERSSSRVRVLPPFVLRFVGQYSLSVISCVLLWENLWKQAKQNFKRNDKKVCKGSPWKKRTQCVAQVIVQEPLLWVNRLCEQNTSAEHQRPVTKKKTSLRSSKWTHGFQCDQGYFSNHKISRLAGRQQWFRPRWKSGLVNDRTTGPLSTTSVWQWP